MLTENALKSFIEVQFPVSKLSKESYTERKSNKSQTLTGLGRWWGRKPLVLVRAVLLGILLPSTDDPQKDRALFLKLLCMDEEGLWRRKDKNLSPADVYGLLTADEVGEWFETADPPKYRRSLSESAKQAVQKLAFSRLSFDAKMEYCSRAEEIEGPAAHDWIEINAHLSTSASNLSELVAQLGERTFGHTPRVGDAFCGGGSIPFEAARLGCIAYGSDLNPVATLLTWASLNIVGGGQEVAERIRNAQNELYAAVDRQICEWGIEHNAQGWRASTYLYCVETQCPACGWRVSLSSTWLIAPNFKVIATLTPDSEDKSFIISIEKGVSAERLKHAEDSATVKGDYMYCPNDACRTSTPISLIRGDNRPGGGLRLWTNNDVVPRSDDIFQERLYCVRWVETTINKDGKPSVQRHYRAPDAEDVAREAYTLRLLRERFVEWQEKGYIPSRPIDTGEKTEEPIRTRGWTYWHHLFNPRQLLIIGLFSQLSEQYECPEANLLLVGKLANFNSRLSRWVPVSSQVKDVFSNQALNSLYNYGCRTLGTPQKVLIEIPESYRIEQSYTVETKDCRTISQVQDIWVTDPPYADAINYHELSEFFLAWYEKKLPKLFPGWYSDSRRALAVSGAPDVFRRSMVDCYRNLALHMPDNGVQVVMFTHQDAAVWADLALILWASGLSVSAAWSIVTETNSALKEGNYVQGTVIMVLRKQLNTKRGYLDEVYPEVQIVVEAQLAAMQALEDKEDPNFTDTDYQLAAYAAALRVLTSYSKIGEIDVGYELSKERRKGDVSPVEKLIEEAVRIACEYLVPHSFDSYMWKRLTPEERFYIKGLDIAKSGEHRVGAYQELARGFGLKEYKYMLGDNKANQATLKTATNFGDRDLSGVGFGGSLVRNVLFAIREIVRTEDVQHGKNWLRAEVIDYWERRRALIEICRYLGSVAHSLPEWQEDSRVARLLSGALENDHV